METKKETASHKLILENRQRGTFCGVSEVQSFHESEIVLVTNAGKMKIKGELLHMKRLDLEHGEAEIEGKINGLLYLSKNTKKKEESLWKRMFR